MPVDMGKFKPHLAYYTLSLARVGGTGNRRLEEGTKLYMDVVMSTLPATEKRLMHIQIQQDSDNILIQLKRFCNEGWLDKFSIEKAFQPYLTFAGELTTQNGLGQQNCNPPVTV